jgi:hypothetical protein
MTSAMVAREVLAVSQGEDGRKVLRVAGMRPLTFSKR